MEAKAGSPGSGKINRLFSEYAFVTPDQKQYGSSVFMPRESAGLITDLQQKFKIGDRVKFVFIKTLKWGGCPWTTGNVIKDDIPHVDAPSPDRQASARVFRNCDGTIKKIRNGRGWINVKKPFAAEAFFSSDYESLFPVGTSVEFDLVDQVRQYECSWLALNVRRKPIDQPQAKTGEDMIMIEKGESTANHVSPPSIPLTMGDRSARSAAKALITSCIDITGDSSLKVQSFSDAKESKTTPPFLDRQRLRPVNMAPQSMAHRCTQTDPVIEASMLSRLLNDKEVFDFVCPRYPDIIHQWITRSSKNK